MQLPPPPVDAINRYHSSSLHNDSGISSSAVTTVSHNLSISTVMSTSTNSASTTTTMDNSSVKETKQRKIWGILGGRSKSSSADKQKSATLGREKDRTRAAVTTAAAASKFVGGGGSANSSMSEGQIKPLPANISKEKLCSLLEMKLADPQLYCEFERIPKRVENAKYDSALSDENKNKNYDLNFLPYDNNQVRLTPTRDNRMGNVNASHITTTVWEADVQLSNELSCIPQTSERCLEYGQVRSGEFVRRDDDEDGLSTGTGRHPEQDGTALPGGTTHDDIFGLFRRISSAERLRKLRECTERLAQHKLPMCIYQVENVDYRLTAVAIDGSSCHWPLA